ncbi:MAG: hypothetical protein JWO36_3079 [Myxococcales bacterium]|nr:hypothetical protein [Myxococcales bacterium]
MVAVPVKHLLAIAMLASSASAQTSERGTTTAPISAKADDEEGVPKLSLPTEADRVAWQKSGFRLGLGLAYGRFDGLRGAPSGRLLGAQLHAGLRLDESWSVYVSFQYAAVSQAGGLSGLRFAGTIDPTWHVTPRFALAGGFGFGGIVEGRTGRTDAVPPTTDVSYTFPNASMPIASCSGVGAAGLARATWTYVLGPRASTDVALEVIGQYTACTRRSGFLDADTARPIEFRQFWSHAGVTLSWGVAWR